MESRLRLEYASHQPCEFGCGSNTGRNDGADFDILVRLNEVVELWEFRVVGHIAALDVLRYIRYSADVLPRRIDPGFNSGDSDLGFGVDSVVAKMVFSSFDVLALREDAEFRPLVTWQVDQRLVVEALVICLMSWVLFAGNWFLLSPQT